MPYGKHSSFTAFDSYALFDSDESLKSIAERFKVSPNTLRQWWLEKFGRDLFDKRNDRIRALGHVKTGEHSRGKSRSVRKVSEPCAICGTAVTVSLIQRAHFNRILCPSCTSIERGFDRYCPVCGLGCVGQGGLSSHFARPPVLTSEAHAKYLVDMEEAKWSAKLENQEYVICKLCGHRAESLARHLLAEHGITAKQYKVLYPDALIRSIALKAVRGEAIRQGLKCFGQKGRTKQVICPDCSQEHAVSLYFAYDMHDPRCPDCKRAAFEEEQDHIYNSFNGKKEPDDYVECRICNYRAENLTSHIRSEHPDFEGYYLDIFPGSDIIALNSSIRVKTEATREAMSCNANNWQKGNTKESDSRIALAAKKRGVTVSRKIAEGSWHVWGTPQIELTKEQLAPYCIKNGKLSIGKAMVALSHSSQVIKREALKHGYTISRVHIREDICISTIAMLLGNPLHTTEWNDGTFRNPLTGYCFRYDGFFPEHNLLVEYFGYYHYIFPNMYTRTQEAFDALQERDRQKAMQVEQDGRFKLLVIREDEPYDDPDYLRQRLVDLGILDEDKPTFEQLLSGI